MTRRLVAAAVVLAAVMNLPSCGLLGRDAGGYTVIAYFPKAVSLYEQSPVRVLGLPAGRIEEIAVEGTEVRVTMRIRDAVPIPVDVNATIIPISLIGERYVQLSPAWTRGLPRAQDGHVIARERSTVPVEPDEALEALKDLLDTLDPEATGRLVGNLAGDLEGTGADFNAALAGLAELTGTFAEKDAEIARIIEHFDRFTATLRTRDTQLGRVLDAFADTTGLLAAERRTIESVVANLAQLAGTGLDLVGRHASELDRDLTTLTRTLRAVELNVESLRQLLDAGPLLVAGEDLDGTSGLYAAWDEKYHHLDLRNSASPTVAQLLTALGFPALSFCLPVDVSCAPPPPTASGSAASAPDPTAAADLPSGTDAGPGERRPGATTTTAAAAPPRRSTEPTARRDGWLRRVARSLAEVFA